MPRLLLLLLLSPAIALATAGPASAQTCPGSCLPWSSGCTGTTSTICYSNCCNPGSYFCCIPSGVGPGGISGVSGPPGLRSEFTDYSRLVANLARRFLLFAIALSGTFFLYRLITAGFAYMNAKGEPGSIQSGTKQITNALIGLIVVTMAFFIIQIIQSIFRITIL
ncbi:hypothetical protein A2634_02965 [Candidatus Amesbacteria bacterium RIFCSPHIGHO2_01_FULL_48_32]|uniref:Uncharacterized protein n=1 Tax=Candidatus Amesbacteria bacterium RIFCSPLOWO2_01_FULL_48_25 TaxID=1797259 RepID=A0A1F4Z9Z3_9BACT|nr:MAG: hypothetical protein A2634_02965 [Candidatus Amesbacteria bacterium RIFCSPHIGHO2_01_FULL_48_32]OGD03102.1 MAG: hypothetical protein A2989_02185 [Candidatus Amesbacteria bacterium RIFCSPLOWO2_01_FULL_48_25]